jgi:altronate hydrolase
MKNNALRLDEKDNVAIATHPIAKGDEVIINGRKTLATIEDVDAGHKLALAEIAKGEAVFRYGEPIVQATRHIKKGEWVHVHNTQPIPGDLKE